jgi:galactokinase
MIGEHVDYALFGVLPAAIENQMAIAIRATPDSKGSITVSNLDPEYTEATFSASKDNVGNWGLVIDQKALRWESYVKAGYLVGPWYLHSNEVSDWIVCRAFWNDSLRDQ